MNRHDTFFSVDIESAGPYPGNYAMLSIGACLADDLTRSFYCELQPDAAAQDPGAMAISGLSLAHLAETGTPPREAMQAFADWVASCLPAGSRPVFLAFNAPFDWMFINEYFHRYLDANPFGHNALDIKALYMGFRRLTSYSAVRDDMNTRYPPSRPLTHNALEDARDQARLFQKLMQDMYEGVNHV